MIREEQSWTDLEESVPDDEELCGQNSALASVRTKNQADQSSLSMAASVKMNQASNLMMASRQQEPARNSLNLAGAYSVSSMLTQTLQRPALGGNSGSTSRLSNHLASAARGNDPSMTSSRFVVSENENKRQGTDSKNSNNLQHLSGVNQVYPLRNSQTPNIVTSPFANISPLAINKPQTSTLQQEKVRFSAKESASAVLTDKPPAAIQKEAFQHHRRSNEPMQRKNPLQEKTNLAVQVNLSSRFAGAGSLIEANQAGGPTSGSHLTMNQDFKSIVSNMIETSQTPQNAIAAQLPTQIQSSVRQKQDQSLEPSEIQNEISQLSVQQPSVQMAQSMHSRQVGHLSTLNAFTMRQQLDLTERVNSIEPKNVSMANEQIIRNLLLSNKPNQRLSRQRMSRSVTKPQWCDLERVATQPSAFAAAKNLLRTGTHQLNTSSKSGLVKGSSGVHERLYQEHKAHQKRRSSIYDPERKDKEIESSECTFQPCIDKSQYSRAVAQGQHSGATPMMNRESLTSTYFDYDQQSSMKKRCRSNPRNQTMPNFAMASTLSGMRSKEQFYADMTQHKERREMKVERLRQTLTKEQKQKHQEDFDTVSQCSKRSFSMVSCKSFKQIRKQIRCRSNQKRQSLVDEITPSFQPILVANSNKQIWRRGSVGDLLYQNASQNSPLGQESTSTSMMLNCWRNKSALQRFADDLQQREVNMNEKIAQNENRIKETLGPSYKANGKSDDYLLRHFFAHFAGVCQAYYFPGLLQLDEKSSPEEQQVYAEQESGSCAGEEAGQIQDGPGEADQKTNVMPRQQVQRLLKEKLASQTVTGDQTKVIMEQLGFIDPKKTTAQERDELKAFLSQMHKVETSKICLTDLYLALCELQKFAIETIDQNYKKQLSGVFHALLTHRKSYLTGNKREGISKKVKQEIEEKNPLRPAIAKKSIDLASKANEGEFRRTRRLSQKAHCQMLTKPSAKKENQRNSIRKLSQEVEVLDCTFKPVTNATTNAKIGFSEQKKIQPATVSGAGSVLAQGTSKNILSQRDLARRNKLYEQGHKLKIDRPRDEVELEKAPGEYTFVPNQGAVSQSAKLELRKKAMTPSGVKSTSTLKAPSVLTDKTSKINLRGSFQPKAQLPETVMSLKSAAFNQVLPIRENVAPMAQRQKTQHTTQLRQMQEPLDETIAEESESPNAGLKNGGAPIVLRLDIKVAKDQTKQLVIDRTMDDPLLKAQEFCAENGLSAQQASKLTRVIQMNLPQENLDE